MSKKRKTRKKNQPLESAPAQKPAEPKPETFWTKHQSTILAFAALYLLIAFFFAPVVFQGKGLTPAPDMMAVAGMNKMGEEAIKDFRFPLWNPTLYCGMPLFASLQYALFTYPSEYPIRLLSYIFGVTHYRVWLFHYLLAGIFAFLLARHFKCGRIASLLVGAGYAFSPQLIVLVDVGHGSKLMGMVYLPLIWLLLDRLRIKPTIGRAAALGAVFAVEILSLHPQVAAYGAILMAVYLIYYGVRAFVESKPGAWIRTGTLWLGAMIVSLMISAILWMSVLDYARFSMRGSDAGGVAAGGVDWQYATGWSFHPLESITFLFPKWFGFAGGTYWGTVGTADGTPFTQNPMYFGIVIFMLMVLTIAVAGKKKWGFPLTLGIVALVLSFGRYVPLLYGPMYHILPFFNKFRAPVMGLVLLLLPAVLMAGLGLQWLIDKSREDKIKPLLPKVFYWIAGIAAFKAVIILLAPGIFNGFYNGFADLVPSKYDPRVFAAALEMARPDAARVWALVAIMGLFSGMLMQKRIPWQVLAGVFLIIFVLDLYPINRNLISFQTISRQKLLLEPESVVTKLKKDKDKFRVHSLDQSYPAIYWQRTLGMRSNAHPANWLSYFEIESTTGYFGAKPGPFQKLINRAGLDANAPYSWRLLMTRPQLLDALNVRYILTTVPLDMAFAEMEKQGFGGAVRPAKDYRLELMPKTMQPGSGAFLYRNPGELPRVRFVDSYRVIEGFDQTLNTMLSQNWNPTRETLLASEPTIEPKAGGSAKAEIKMYEPERIEITTSSDADKLLILADAYYPSGWTAHIDGQQTEIIRADGVLRAIAVPAGDHKIEFIFRPAWFYTGLWISLISVFGLLLWFVLWYMRNQSSVKKRTT